MNNTIKKIVGLEYEIDNKIFLRALSSYPYSYDAIDSTYLSHITKVWVTYKNSKTIVHIKTHRPGILIGKAGTLINSIRQYMEELSGTVIEIDIQEEKMFSNLYD